MRVREYQQGYDTKALVSKIPTPKKQRIAFTSPLKGVNYRGNPAMLSDDESPLIRNARVNKDYISPRPIWLAFAAVGDIETLWIGEFPLSSGSVYFVALSTAAVYVSSDLSSWTEVPFDTSLGFTGTMDDPFWAQTIADADYLVFSNGVDPVMYLNSSVDLVRRLSADCPAARHGIVYADRLILGQIPDYPYRQQWCVRGDYDNWTGEGSGFKDWVEEPSKITGFSILNNILIVYKERSINQVSQTGLAASPFNYLVHVPDMGMDLRGPVQVTGADLLISRDNIYAYDASSLSPTGDKVKDRIVDGVNQSLKDLAIMFYDRKQDQVQMHLPSSNAEGPDVCYPYNPKLNCWEGKWDYTVGVVTHWVTSVRRVSTRLWSTAIGTWAEATGEWYLVSEQEGAPMTIGVAFGLLYELKYGGVPGYSTYPEFEWWTKEFISPSLMGASVFRVIVNYRCTVGGELTCSLSPDGGRTFPYEQTTILDPRNPYDLKKAYFDFINTLPSVLLRFFSNDGAYFEITHVQVEGMELGELNEQ